ncbi:hypothetical protein B0T36_22925 [Nocardia donostiensis]|uniref:hypothetical protein n=1 Tax=Nocardia donostiensis TaxID=1538463 RepID=UPI0009DAA7A2|nr:hypothetical protein [Nocardia donostiensis]OQS12819.1 hypothetical protein B0T36_22925 [Nocardia donostiensis]
MPVPFVIGAAAIVGIIAGGAQISRNHNESAENETSANSARDGAAKHWSGDRQIISSEWGRISEGFDGQYAPAKATQEAFKTWTHKQIWEALNGNDQDPGGVSQADVNAGADGWRSLKKGTETAIDDFRKEVDRAINDLWSGQAANAAMEGTRKYTDEAKKLPLSFQMVANGIDLMQGYLGQAKMAVEPPVEVSGFDEFMGHIPGNGVLKLNKHRANEAQALAQDVMIEVYQPGVIEVDGRTPILPTPHNPVTDPGEDPTTGPGTPGNPGNPGGPSTPGSPGNTPPTTEAPGENPNTQTPGQQPTTPSNTTPASTEPTVPSSTTTPQTYLEDPLGRPNTPGTPNTPGSPASPGYPG